MLRGTSESSDGLHGGREGAAGTTETKEDGIGGARRPEARIGRRTGTGARGDRKAFNRS